MRKYLSVIGVLLVLVVFNLGPKAEVQVFPYVSPALLLGINLTIAQMWTEAYLSLSAQVAAGIVVDDITDANRF